MKKLFFIAALTAVSFIGKAQKSSAGMQGFKIQGGLDLGIPASNLEGTSIAAGVDLLAQYGVSDNIAIRGDIGTTAYVFFNDIKQYKEARNA